MNTASVTEVLVSHRIMAEELQGQKIKVDAIYEKLVMGKGVVLGMRLGVMAVLIAIGATFVLIYSFAVGKISISDLLSGISKFV